MKFTIRVNRVPSFISFLAPTFALQSLSLDEIMKLVSSVSRRPVLLLGCMRRQNKCVYFGILLLDRHVFDLATRCLKSEGSEWCCHLCGDTAVWGAVTSGITAPLSVCADATRWWHWGDRSITLLPQPFLPCVAFLQLFIYFFLSHIGIIGFNRFRAGVVFERMMRAEGFGLVGICNYCHCKGSWHENTLSFTDIALLSQHVHGGSTHAQFYAQNLLFCSVAPLPFFSHAWQSPAYCEGEEGCPKL